MSESNQLSRRLSKWNGFTAGLGRPLLTCLILLSLVRFLTWWMAYELFLFASARELAEAFLVGVRFDLLVLGFLLMPVAAAGSALVLWREPGPGFQALGRRYLAAAWMSAVVLSAADVMTFPSLGRHRRWTDPWEMSFDTAHTMTLLILICVALLGAREWLWARPRPVSERLGLTRWFLGLFAVALMARGTVTAHHLGREHTEVSVINEVNELVMNSVWALDKNP